jgi:hypothetical protein
MRIIDWKTLKIMVPYCRQHLARLERVGKFPQGFALGMDLGAEPAGCSRKWKPGLRHT